MTLNFPKDMFDYYNQYKNVWTKINKFIENDSYKKYYLDNYKKIDLITKEWKKCCRYNLALYEDNRKWRSGI
nr:hypothetical protein [Mycoplasmopsis bovis]